MSKYFISVIMPIYNAEKYVKKSIDSLVNQTTNEIEIILVDDGSTDGSGSICDQYDESENVKIIHKENGGICTARNAGLLQAEGQYVSFIDSDDFMDLVAYEKIIKVLKNNRKNFVFDFSWNKIYRKEIIDKYQIHFDEKRNTWEDRIFIVEFLKYCKNYYCMDECFYNYVSVPNSLSRRYNAQYLELILANYNLYVELFGEDYDFSAQYVTDYWCRSVENMIIQQLRVKDQNPEVI